MLLPAVDQLLELRQVRFRQRPGAGRPGRTAVPPEAGEKQTAERLVIELRSRVGATDSAIVPGLPEGTTSDPGESAHRDAIAALIALGYKPADADQAVRRAALAVAGKVTTESLVKRALSQS